MFQVKQEIMVTTRTILVLSLSVLFQVCSGMDVFQEKRIVNSSELCIIPITPSLFNWEKSPESVNEIEYTARISGFPDLPDWLQYTYDGVSSTGFLYGVPPEDLKSISLDVIAWNHYADYEVRMLIISLEIMKRAPDPYTIQFKIDNMNVQDLCNHTTMNRVLGIFSQYLNWTNTDGQNVHPVYLASAVELGENRIPLKPSDAEGVVVHFASERNFSKALRKLEEEVLKLPKLKPCPRDMKRTSMERYFRSQDVLVDWCYFRLRTIPPRGAGIGTTPPTIVGQIDGEAVKHISGNEEGTSGEEDIFHFRTEIPERSYGMGIILATVIPGTIGGLVGFLLLALLWSDRDEDMNVDGDGLFFEAAFRELEKYLNRFRKRGQYESDYRSAENEPDLDVGIITRDPVEINNFGVDREAMHTPLPPQYGETHPNGSPALIYAV